MGRRDWLNLGLRSAPQTGEVWRKDESPSSPPPPVSPWVGVSNATLRIRRSTSWSTTPGATLGLGNTHRCSHTRSFPIAVGVARTGSCCELGTDGDTGKLSKEGLLLRHVCLVKKCFCPEVTALEGGHPDGASQPSPSTVQRREPFPVCQIPLDTQNVV